MLGSLQPDPCPPSVFGNTVSYLVSRLSSWGLHSGMSRVCMCYAVQRSDFGTYIGHMKEV